MGDCCRVFIKVVYIIFFFSGFVVFIISLIQISYDYGFNNIIPILETFIDNLEKKILKSNPQ